MPSAGCSRYAPSTAREGWGGEERAAAPQLEMSAECNGMLNADLRGSEGFLAEENVEDIFSIVGVVL